MLHLGLTGGIGSGKSTVARRLAELGAVVVDADQVAREVVAKGEPALAQIAERFGDHLLTEEGELDRPALGRVVFGDPAALRDLEAITHPAIWERTARLREQARAEGARVLVHDMPLLLEKDMGAQYHLVLVVDTSEETRVRRLVEHRGIPEEDARARMRSQVSDAQRRAAADVLLGNEGTPEDLAAQVDRLWAERLTPFADNLVAGRAADRPSVVQLADPDPIWPGQADRLIARIRHALGDRLVSAHHVGSTAVPGLVAKDVIDIQLGVAHLEDADDPAFVEALTAAGYPRRLEIDHDVSKDDTPWPKRYHLTSDPGRMTHVHVREVGSPGWQWTLLVRDWLRADPEARADYAAMKREIVAADGVWARYPEAKEPWFAVADSRAQEWARRTRWQPGED
ncbi:dephospho-CoA kinase [Marihabitans asiaticum]|nr:dephospho-CoA kinase [Marihabitans asiaticum]